MRLRDLDLNEHWLQDWLAADPRRLGLGDVKLVEQEQTQSGGGSLDILATSGDIYFSIEVQLGEVDASHGFRVYDYWARNRKRQPGKTHIAVLVAESASGRFRIALEALAEYTPLIVIELRAWRAQHEVVLVPEVVVKNESLDLGDAPAGALTAADRTPEDWRVQHPSAWQFHEAFLSWVKANLGDVQVSYAVKSYIGVRRGRRVWAPIWPNADGATLHLPDPDGSKDEESPAYDYFRNELTRVGLAPSWTPSYNAGANPVSLRLREPDLGKPAVQRLLRASFEILSGGAPWSERQSDPLDGASDGAAPEPAALGDGTTSMDQVDGSA
ncbi:hypothetical protein [Yinghuangia seranimata]|uniref:hypothetical protein n=1 Tax=Yinghuangia seranimata TaxID=408067 RepID=UPI00248C29AF|nr:hypothetical protein [Yinghuangia seranimata]MDI2125087.1 hypothetical protein [Yinghuangia seranimata]